MSIETPTISAATTLGPRTRGTDESALASVAAESTANQEGWDRVIAHTLVEWRDDPDRLCDIDVFPPSDAVIEFGIHLARQFRDDLKWPAPQRVAPNGDGGITFERWDGEDFQSVELEEDFSVFLSTFQGAKLVCRSRIV